MPEVGDHVVSMRLNKFLTSVLIQIDPTYSTYVQKNGSCVVRLRKALYGCVESAAMWHSKLSADLATLGYSINKLDACVTEQKKFIHKLLSLQGTKVVLLSSESIPCLCHNNGFYDTNVTEKRLNCAGDPAVPVISEHPSSASRT